MTDDAQTELGILGNILLILTLDAGGRIEIPRSRWKEIKNVMASRVHDEKTNTDIIEIVSNQDKEVQM